MTWNKKECISLPSSKWKFRQTRSQTQNHKEDGGIFPPRWDRPPQLKNRMKQMEKTSKLQLCPAIKFDLRMVQGMFWGTSWGSL